MDPIDRTGELEALRPQLMKFARLQLRNPAWAEDAVSETLLAALEHPQAFAGRSQLKTWLIGILKHKLVDQIRRHGRELSTSSDEGEDIEDLLFRADGHWREAPQDWGIPSTPCVRSSSSRCWRPAPSACPANWGASS
jgi:RNA polymerase sigma-70 factor (TIGR02943 family)